MNNKANGETPKQKVVQSEELSEWLNKGWIVKFTFKHAGIECGYIIEKVEDNPVASISHDVVEEFCKSDMCTSRGRRFSIEIFVL